MASQSSSGPVNLTAAQLAQMSLSPEETTLLTEWLGEIEKVEMTIGLGGHQDWIDIANQIYGLEDTLRDAAQQMEGDAKTITDQVLERLRDAVKRNPRANVFLQLRSKSKTQLPKKAYEV